MGRQWRMVEGKDPTCCEGKARACAISSERQGRTAHDCLLPPTFSSVSFAEAEGRRRSMGLRCRSSVGRVLSTKDVPPTGDFEVELG